VTTPSAAHGRPVVVQAPPKAPRPPRGSVSQAELARRRSDWWLRAHHNAQQERMRLNLLEREKAAFSPGTVRNNRPIDLVLEPVASWTGPVMGLGEPSLSSTSASRAEHYRRPTRPQSAKLVAVGTSDDSLCHLSLCSTEQRVTQPLFAHRTALLPVQQQWEHQSGAQGRKWGEKSGFWGRWQQ
jgi:hypothetical protein